VDPDLTYSPLRSSHGDLDLVELRRELGDRTQAEAAQLPGVTPGTWASWERGEFAASPSSSAATLPASTMVNYRRRVPVLGLGIDGIRGVGGRKVQVRAARHLNRVNTPYSLTAWTRMVHRSALAQRTGVPTHTSASSASIANGLATTASACITTFAALGSWPLSVYEERSTTALLMGSSSDAKFLEHGLDVQAEAFVMLVEGGVEDACWVWVSSADAGVGPANGQCAAGSNATTRRLNAGSRSAGRN
jgi:hypothetical protein